MRIISRVSVSAAFTALVLMGAGCAPSSVPSDTSPTPAPSTVPAAGVPNANTQGSGSTGETMPSGAPVTGYEYDIANPAQ